MSIIRLRLALLDLALFCFDGRDNEHVLLLRSKYYLRFVTLRSKMHAFLLSDTQQVLYECVRAGPPLQLPQGLTNACIYISSMLCF